MRNKYLITLRWKLIVSCSGAFSLSTSMTQKIRVCETKMVSWAQTELITQDRKPREHYQLQPRQSQKPVDCTTCLIARRRKQAPCLWPSRTILRCAAVGVSTHSLNYTQPPLRPLSLNTHHTVFLLYNHHSRINKRGSILFHLMAFILFI